MKNSDEKVAVIGRGIVGLASAFELLRRGASVDVYGLKGTWQRASEAAQGIYNMKGVCEAKKEDFQRKLEGHHLLLKLVKHVENLSKTKVKKLLGVYEPFRDLEEYKRIKKRIYHREFSSLFNYQVFSRDELVSMNPYWLGSSDQNLAGAFFFPDDYWIETTELLSALELGIRNLGGRFVEAKISKFQAGPKGFELLGEGCDGFFAKDLIIAAGGFSSQLLSSSGYSGFQLDLVGGAILRASVRQNVQIAIKKERRTGVVFGGVLRYGSADYDVASLKCLKPMQQAENVEKRLLENLTSDIILDPKTDFAKQNFRYGVRAKARDRVPYFGQVVKTGQRPFYVATGVYKSGFQLAGYYSHHLAKVITDGRPEKSLKLLKTYTGC